MCIEWNKDFEIGFDCIDTQHKIFIQKINNLHKLIVSKGNQDEKNVIINEFIQYSEYHFETEEKLMNKYKYPQSEAHVKRHEEYIRKVDKMKKDAENGTFFNIKAFIFLKNWLITHIMKEDKGYGKYLKKLNVPKDIEIN